MADLLDIHVHPVAGPDHPGDAVRPARGVQVPPAADPQALEPPAHNARTGGTPHGAARVRELIRAGPLVGAAHALDLFHPPRLQRTWAMAGARQPVPQAGPAPVLVTVPPLGRGHPRNTHLGRNMGDQHTRSDAYHQTALPFDGQRRIRVGHSCGPLNQDTDFDTPHPARGPPPHDNNLTPTTPSSQPIAPLQRGGPLCRQGDIRLFRVECG